MTDSDAILRWAVDAAAPGGTVTEVVTLREPSGPYKLRIARDGRHIDVILKVRPPGWHEVASEVAAMRFAATHGLPVPAVIAADLDGSLGVVGYVCTAIEGDSTIPAVAIPDRLRAAGAAAARIHRVRLDPSPAFPLRTRQMPWVDFSEERRGGRSPTTPLLGEVDAFLASTPAPKGVAGFVHGDLWQGNLLFDGELCVGVIDWEAAGAGDAGIDLGSLRWDAAILWNGDAADHVLSGWEAESGRRATDVAYWDLVAAANTPADQSAMIDAISQQGRGDLDGGTLNERRDRFIEKALEQLR